VEQRTENLAASRSGKYYFLILDIFSASLSTIFANRKSGNDIKAEHQIHYYPMSDHELN